MEALRAKTAARRWLGLRQPSPAGHAQTNRNTVEDFMAFDDADTVYCDIQMPLLLGKEFLQLVAKIRASGTYPNLKGVFADIQYELTNSIDFVENPRASGDWFPTRH
jgi:hypothetical protein